jgi:sugar lactone lactonase YvrE
MAYRAEVVSPAGAQLGEGPAWDAATATLWWVDILGRRLHGFDGAEVSSRDLAYTPSLAAPRGDGTLILVTDEGLVPYDPVAGGYLQPLPIEPGRPGNRSNDSKVSPCGRLVVGTMSRAFERRAGAFYAVEPSGEVRRLVEAITVPNGLAWSPDGKWVLYADSGLQTVYRAPWDVAAGVAGEPEPFLQPPWPSAPDGAAMDADGVYWAALWDGGRVVGVGPDGRQLAEIPLPVARPTACAFGGADLKTLYVTSAAEGDDSRLAGSLFAVAMPTAGVPVPPFTWSRPELPKV